MYFGVIPQWVQYFFTALSRARHEHSKAFNHTSELSIGRNSTSSETSAALHVPCSLIRQCNPFICAYQQLQTLHPFILTSTVRIHSYFIAIQRYVLKLPFHVRHVEYLHSSTNSTFSENSSYVLFFPIFSYFMHHTFILPLSPFSGSAYVVGVWHILAVYRRFLDASILWGMWPR